MLGEVYGKNGSLNTNQSLGVKVATPVGTLIGQLLFGWLADVVGRKRMCKFLLILNKKNSAKILFVDGVELMIIIVGTFAQALAGSGPAVGVIGVLIVWRGIVSLD